MLRLVASRVRGSMGVGAGVECRMLSRTGSGSLNRFGTVRLSDKGIFRGKDGGIMSRSLSIIRNGIMNCVSCRGLVNYEKKSPVEHVLLRPGMYIGQVETTTSDIWLYDSTKQAMVKEQVQYNPALLKIFDEILVNAADNRERDPNMSYVEISIQNKVGEDLQITVKNDGKSLPLVLHDKEKIYVPELVFGHLLTGSNFNDTENRLTGGSHGYGAKLTNIFSHSFSVEAQDGDAQVCYKQTWTENMSNVSLPSLTISDSKNSYTKITFRPDLRKFGALDQTPSAREVMKQHAIRLFQRRALDISACIAPATVRFNVYTGDDTVDNDNRQTEIPNVQSFKDYVRLFEARGNHSSMSEQLVGAGDCSELGENNISTNSSHSTGNIVFSQPSPRWEVAVGPSCTGSFENMSFVNSVWTVRGGTHVNLITAQIVKAIEAVLTKKGVPSTPSSIKSKMMVFVNCKIENPSFDGQTKDALNTKPSAFGSTCKLPATFLKEIIAETGIVDSLVLEAASRETNKLNEKFKSTRNSVISVPKLEDAHAAGTDKALDCTLILTEGDSAKALAVAGLEVVGRKLYGVLPLRGKIINVRGAENQQVFRNEEFLNICKALGLSFNKTYSSGLENQGLRYGKVMIMCDQDTDGSHIKGLVINLFHYYWPSLLKYEGFLQQFVTPIVKARPTGGRSKSKVGTISFFSIPEFKKWQEEKAHSDTQEIGHPHHRSEAGVSASDSIKRYSIKYYKGLGTSTASEGKEYFSALNKHCKSFRALGYDDIESIDLAFNRDRADDRKTWLIEKHNAKVFLDPHLPDFSYSQFIDKELIHFSYGDVQRSIPSVVDGLKPSQRKVLFGCLKKNLIKEESKVVQIAGYIAEHTAYHHGEVSLHSTIINMAQDFVGSNNVPLLIASGQFGTRAQGGNDHASPRYVFTRLSPLARVLFPEEDDELLQYEEEDGISVEPRFFVPVLPVLLLNGAHGIGTGWSTYVPPFHLPHVVEQVRCRILGTELPPPLEPYIVGFHGKISRCAPHGLKYETRGVIERISGTKLVISELPYGIWTHDYKSTLVKFVESGVIKDFLELHSSNAVRFEIVAPKARIDKWESSGNLETIFRLRSTISLSNMHAFNHHGKIKRYNCTAEIIDEHFEVRYEAYKARKAMLERKHTADEMRCSNQSRFIGCILNGEIELIPRSGLRTSAAELVDKLRLGGFADEAMIDRIRSGITDNLNANTSSVAGEGGFGYLLDMPIFSLTNERALKLQSSASHAAERLRCLQAQSIEDMWLADLDKVSRVYETLAAER